MVKFTDWQLDAVSDSWWAEPHTYARQVSRGVWKPYPYLRYIGRIIANAVAQGNARIIVNIPPRHGKSLFTSHWVPTWYLDMYPDRRVIPCSYGAELAESWGRAVRNEATNNELVRFKLRDDSTSARRWHTQAGGGMLCAGVGGGVTGFGGDLILIDDPHKSWEEAWSPIHRRRVIEWFSGTLYSRLEPKGSIVVLSTRWHPKDLCGWLIEDHSDDWRTIRLPAIAEEADEIGRLPGEALCPERYSVDDLHRIRAAVGEAAWQASFQQNPGAASAGVAYDHFGAANIDPGITLRAGEPLCVSFDFNINPGMHAIVGHYNAKTDRFDVVHELHGYRWPLERCIEELRTLIAAQKWKAAPELHVFGDASGGGASVHDGRTSWQIVRQRCAAFSRSISVKVPPSNPGIKDSLDTANDAISDAAGGKHVHIHPRCERLIADMREVQRDEDGLIDKSDPLLTHAGDCLRYWVYYLRPLGGRRKITGGRVSVV